MALPRSFGSASAVVLWAALEAGHRVSAGLHGGGAPRVWGLHGGVGSAPAAPPVRPMLGGCGEKVPPAGRASLREGRRRGPESSGSVLL